MSVKLDALERDLYAIRISKNDLKIPIKPKSKQLTNCKFSKYSFIFNQDFYAHKSAYLIAG